MEIVDLLSDQCSPLFFTQFSFYPSVTHKILTIKAFLATIMLILSCTDIYCTSFVKLEYEWKMKTEAMHCKRQKVGCSFGISVLSKLKIGRLEEVMHALLGAGLATLRREFKLL